MRKSKSKRTLGNNTDNTKTTVFFPIQNTHFYCTVCTTSDMFFGFWSSFWKTYNVHAHHIEFNGCISSVFFIATAKYNHVE